MRRRFTAPACELRGKCHETTFKPLVGNEQFLRAMIPHHSSAILMGREASVTDPEIAKLCGEITCSQEAEIDEMRAILERY